MINHSLLNVHYKLTKLGSTLALIGLSGSSLLFTSCTTEEGIVAGALAGAAIGGIVGHSQERDYKRSKRHYRNYNRYGYGDRYDHGNRYYREEYYAPRRSAYRSARYSSYRGNSFASDPYCYY